MQKQYNIKINELTADNHCIKFSDGPEYILLDATLKKEDAIFFSLDATYQKRGCNIKKKTQLATTCATTKNSNDGNKNFQTVTTKNFNARNTHYSRAAPSAECAACVAEV